MNYLEKIQASIRRIQIAAHIADLRGEVLTVCFSGGKDSQVMLHLVQRAGVPYHAVYNVTTIDHPANVNFIRKLYPQVHFVHPPLNFWQIVEQRGELPMMLIGKRFCCKKLKEYDNPKGGNGRNNYNRFSWLFDRLLSPKTYAGGNKDGFAWCATFVTMCIGTATFTEKENLVHKVSAASEEKIYEWQKKVLANLHEALFLKCERLQSASLLAGVSSFQKFTAINHCTLSELEPADIVIFGNATCYTAHIGLVESAGGGQFVTIEGNTKMGLATPNGGQVCRKTYEKNGSGLIEIRNGQRIKSWNKVIFYKIKAK